MLPSAPSTDPTSDAADCRHHRQQDALPHFHVAGVWLMGFPARQCRDCGYEASRRAGNARVRNTSGPSTPGCAITVATDGKPPVGCEGRATDWTTANGIRNTRSRLYGVRYAGSPGVSATTVNAVHIAYQRRTGTCRRCAGPVHAAPADSSPAACRPGHEAGGVGRSPNDINTKTIRHRTSAVSSSSDQSVVRTLP